MIGLVTYHIFAIIILGLGIYNIMLSKNIVKGILIIEMMVATANLILFRISLEKGDDGLGRAVIITSIVIGAGLSAFMLSMAVKVYREFGTLNPEEVTRQEE